MPAIQNIKNVIVGLTEEGQQDEACDAIGYGLSLSVAAGAISPCRRPRDVWS